MTRKRRWLTRFLSISLGLEVKTRSLSLHNQVVFVAVERQNYSEESADEQADEAEDVKRSLDPSNDVLYPRSTCKVVAEHYGTVSRLWTSSFRSVKLLSNLNGEMCLTESL